MFRKQPDGVEIYFNWPSRTARVVPDRSVRSAISLRDSIARALVGITFLGQLIVGKEIALVVLIGFIVCMVERGVYLSKLAKVPLLITRAQVDKEYLKTVGVFEGVMLTVFGVLFTAGGIYMVFTHDKEGGVPIFLTIPLIVAFLIVTYAGIRILAGKRPS